jgi:dUTP pyrophosphatase
MTDVTIKFKALDSRFQLPTQGSPDAAGFDMRALDEVMLMPGQRTLVPLGCAVEIPQGYEIQVRPRSGLALKNGITVLNSPGTIDADYRGPCGAILLNASQDAYLVAKDERVCQFVVAKVPTVAVEMATELSDTERGEGGFGSTGKV